MGYFAKETVWVVGDGGCGACDFSMKENYWVVVVMVGMSSISLTHA